tara:strand:- start:1095 stop:2243 length:1149 start_codon:yes stop_codon:yes gene_type:complete
MAGTITIKGGVNSVIQNDENDNLIVTTAGAAKRVFFQGTGSSDSPLFIDENGNTIFQDTGSGQSVSLSVSQSAHGGYQVMFQSGSNKAAAIKFVQDISGSGANQSRAIIVLSGSSNVNVGVSYDSPIVDRLGRAYGDGYLSTGAGGLSFIHAGVQPDSHSFFIGAGLTYQVAYNNKIFEVQEDQYSSHTNPKIKHYIDTEVTNLSASGIVLMTTASIGGGLFTSASLASGGGGGTPGGSNTQVQFNDGGSFGGDSDLVWNSTTNALTINGTLNATRKSFVVNHQKMDNHNLVHGSLEGPEFGAYIRGKVENDNKIALPDYWEWLVDDDSITVHITPIGYHILPLYFKEIKDNYVYVNKKTNFYYYICAERKDIEKLKIIEKK